MCVDFKKLFNNNIGYGTSIDNENYLKSLLYKEFSRRLPRERSLANLGMVNLVFPEVDNLITPQIAIDLGLEDADWKSLINISLDYVIRHKFHYIIIVHYLILTMDELEALGNTANKLAHR